MGRQAACTPGQARPRGASGTRPRAPDDGVCLGGRGSSCRPGRPCRGMLGPQVLSPPRSRPPRYGLGRRRPSRPPDVAGGVEGSAGNFAPGPKSPFLSHRASRSLRGGGTRTPWSSHSTRGPCGAAFVKNATDPSSALTLNSARWSWPALPERGLEPGWRGRGATWALCTPGDPTAGPAAGPCPSACPQL